MKYTWEQIVKKTKLDIGASTAAFYRDRYIQYFQFDESSIEILSLINELNKEGKTHKEIINALEVKSKVFETFNSEQKIMIENIRKVIREESKELLKGIQGLEQKIDELASEIRSNYQNHDEKITEGIRLLQEQGDKPWWKKRAN